MPKCRRGKGGLLEAASYNDVSQQESAKISNTAFCLFALQSGLLSHIRRDACVQVKGAQYRVVYVKIRIYSHKNASLIP